MLDEIGLLDESFFAYGEDVDLGLRGRWAGYNCIYVPAAVVYHKYSATTGTYSPQKAFLAGRNRLWLLFKNFPVVDIRVFFLLYFPAIFPASERRVDRERCIRKVHPEDPAGALFRVILKAEIAALRGLPGILRKRREGKGYRRIGAQEFRRWIRRFALTAEEVALKD